ncbi:hypothetical protein OZD70_02165 [Wolbachia endosymbiont of Drosophila tsacasi]|nr:hypothetical protein [Wolbachia endosymbiont of Drosophila tsacasi]
MFIAKRQPSSRSGIYAKEIPRRYDVRLQVSSQCPDTRIQKT